MWKLLYSNLRSQNLPVLALLALGALNTSCQRKAPGAGECVRAAELIAGFKLKSTDEGSRERRAFQKIVHRCLVGPFDRAYLDCLDGPERQRLCLAEYRRRAELRSTGKGD